MIQQNKSILLLGNCNRREKTILPKRQLGVQQEEEIGGQGGDVLLTARVASNSEVATFVVQAMDQWENPTHSLPEMPYELQVFSEALEPSEASFPFEPLATVTGTSPCYAPEICLSPQAGGAN
jgi:hypothetical protein